MLGPAEYDAADSIDPTRVRIPTDQVKTILKPYEDDSSLLVWLNYGPAHYYDKAAV